MDKIYCDLCKQEFDGDQYDVHIKSHLSSGPIPAPASRNIALEKLPPEDSNFIPELEHDPITGKKKPTPYRQAPYIPSSDFEG